MIKSIRLLTFLTGTVWAATKIDDVSDENDEDFEFEDTERIRPSPYFNFGYTYWMEMLIGGALATPFSWSRLFLSDTGCMRHIAQVSMDVAEIGLHWNELTMVE